MEMACKMESMEHVQTPHLQISRQQSIRIQVVWVHFLSTSFDDAEGWALTYTGSAAASPVRMPCLCNLTFFARPLPPLCRQLPASWPQPCPQSQIPLTLFTRTLLRPRE